MMNGPYDDWCKRFAETRAAMVVLGRQILEKNSLNYSEINGIFSAIIGDGMANAAGDRYNGRLSEKHAITQFVNDWNDKVFQQGFGRADDTLAILACRSFLESLANISLNADSSHGTASSAGVGSATLHELGKASLGGHVAGKKEQTSGTYPTAFWRKIGEKGLGKGT